MRPLPTGDEDMITREQAPIAPDFSMEDSDGRIVQLSDFRGKKNVILVFNRGFS